MKSLIKNKKAVMNPIIGCIFSLALIVFMYFLFMPMMWYITNTLIAMGAPAATALFYMKAIRFGFYLFAIGALLIMLAKVYRKTHDTGYGDIFG